MKKYELTWKDFQKEEKNEKRTAIFEITTFVFFFYFILSFVSFWQFLKGDAPYSAFWHAPWKWLLNVIF